jgi:hypothetical protein
MVARIVLVANDIWRPVANGMETAVGVIFDWVQALNFAIAQIIHAVA